MVRVVAAPCTSSSVRGLAPAEGPAHRCAQRWRLIMLQPACTILHVDRCRANRGRGIGGPGSSREGCESRLLAHRAAPVWPRAPPLPRASLVYVICSRHARRSTRQGDRSTRCHPVPWRRRAPNPQSPTPALPLQQKPQECKTSPYARVRVQLPFLWRVPALSRKGREPERPRKVRRIPLWIVFPHCRWTLPHRRTAKGSWAGALRRRGATCPILARQRKLGKTQASGVSEPTTVR